MVVDPRSRTFSFFAALACLCPAIVAQPEPCGRLPDFGPGLSGSAPFNYPFVPAIYAMQVFDDGSGPALYCAGERMALGRPSSIGGQYQSVCRMQHGIPSPVGYSLGTATAMLAADLGSNLPIGPRLYVGGQSFTAMNPGGASITNLAMWDGQSWQPVGNPGVRVSVLAQFDDGLGGGNQLYAAGSPPAGDTSGRCVSRWNGHTWELLPPFSPGTATPSVADMTVFDDGSGPALYVAGSFGNAQTTLCGLARWNGSTWETLNAPAIGASLTSIRGFLGKLYVLGNFTIDASHSQLAAREPGGTWSTLDVKTAGFSSSGGYRSLSVVDEPAGPVLYIGGLRALPSGQSGTYPSGGLIRYDGVHITLPMRCYLDFVEPGLGQLSASFGPAQAFDDGSGSELYFGGYFRAVADYSNHFDNVDPCSPARAAVRVPLTGPLAGRRLDTGRGVLAVRPSGGSAQVLMRKVRFDGRDQLAFLGTVHGGGGNFSAGLVLFDGQHWTTNLPARTQFRTAAVAASVNGVEGLVLSGSDFFASGPAFVFVSPGATIAQPFATSFVSNAANLAFFDDGSTNGPVLYAQNDSQVVRLINGTVQYVFGPSQQVGSMLVADLGQGPQLLVGGSFSGTWSVASWNGSTFVPLGQPDAFPNNPTSLYVFDDGSGPHLYAGFNGTTNVDGFPTSGILMFDGERWRSLGSGLAYGSTNLAMAGFDDGSGPALYAAGTFGMAGSHASYGFARWKNNDWEPLLDRNYEGSGPLPGPDLSLEVLGDTLYLSGYFSEFGWRPAGAATNDRQSVIVSENLIAFRACPPACFPDINQDGAIDQGDVDYLINAVAGGDNPTGASLDLNNDGVVDQGDVDRLIDVVAGGPCQ